VIQQPRQYLESGLAVEGVEMAEERGTSGRDDYKSPSPFLASRWFICCRISLKKQKWPISQKLDVDIAETCANQFVVRDLLFNKMCISGGNGKVQF